MLLVAAVCMLCTGCCWLASAKKYFTLFHEQNQKEWTSFVIICDSPTHTVYEIKISVPFTETLEANKMENV